MLGVHQNGNPGKEACDRPVHVRRGIVSVKDIRAKSCQRGGQCLDTPHRGVTENSEVDDLDPGGLESVRQLSRWPHADDLRLETSRVRHPGKVEYDLFETAGVQRSHQVDNANSSHNSYSINAAGEREVVRLCLAIMRHERESPVCPGEHLAGECFHAGSGKYRFEVWRVTNVAGRDD